MVDAYRSRHSGLFTEAGQPHRASGLALAGFRACRRSNLGLSVIDLQTMNALIQQPFWSKP
jgi:hypothetical protein